LVPRLAETVVSDSVPRLPFCYSETFKITNKVWSLNNLERLNVGKPMWSGMYVPQPQMQDCSACSGEGKILLFNHFSRCHECGGIGKIKKKEPKEDDDGTFTCIAGL